MANKIILNKQSFPFAEIMGLFPENEKQKKLFFQPELQSLEHGDAKFGILVYAATWEEDRWLVHRTYRGVDSGDETSQSFTPIALANNELMLTERKKKGKKNKKKKNKKDKKRNEFRELFRKVSCDTELAAIARFHCITGISKNPHLTYDVTLEAGAESARISCNPSPPDNPQR